VALFSSNCKHLGLLASCLFNAAAASASTGILTRTTPHLQVYLQLAASRVCLIVCCVSLFRANATKHGCGVSNTAGPIWLSLQVWLHAANGANPVRLRCLASRCVRVMTKHESKVNVAVHNPGLEHHPAQPATLATTGSSSLWAR
jgi:hypothetical protein